MNIADIARKARVSTATVSRTINRSPAVREDTAERIREIIREHGYTPNGSARSLSSGRSNLFGVIVSDINNPFFTELISNFERAAVKHDYQVIFSNTGYSPECLHGCIQRMTERRVDGIAVLTSEMDESAIELLKRQSSPVVTLRTRPRGHPFSTIAVDYKLGIRDAVDHALRLGHRRIAYISGPCDRWTANRRRELYLKEFERRGIRIRPEFLIEGDASVKGGFDSMNVLLKADTQPTAIFSVNDVIAVGALKAIHEAGCTVPGDFSIIGMDDIDLATLVHPSLTTIRIPRPEIAVLAFNSLYSSTRGKQKKTARHTVGTRLIVRRSTGAAARRARST